MNKVILQVPMDKDLKETAAWAAQTQGFSSLQEVVRIFAYQFATGQVRFSLEANVNLSKKSEKRYLKMKGDFKKGKDVYCAHSVKELMQQLHADLLPQKLS